MLFHNLYTKALPKAQLCICTESSEQLQEKFWIKYFPEILDIDFNRFHQIEKIVDSACSMGWRHQETLKLEDVRIEPISDNFMQCVKEKSLSVFELIPKDSYEVGLSLMERDYRKQFPIQQNEGYTFIKFEKGNKNGI